MYYLGQKLKLKSDVNLTTDDGHDDVKYPSGMIITFISLPSDQEDREKGSIIAYLSDLNKSVLIYKNEFEGIVGSRRNLPAWF